MNFKSILFCILTFPLIVIVFSSCDNPVDNDDPTELEGTWIGSYANYPNEIYTYVFSGQNLRITMEGQLVYAATISLRPDRSPKEMDGAITESAYPAYVGKTSLAIYELRDNNDSLIIAGHEPGSTVRPTSLTPASGSGRVVILLERK